MKRFFLGAILFVATVAADSRPGWAYGDAPWCAAVNKGSGNVSYECYFRSAESCALTVTSGNRGQCLQNPEFVGYLPAPRRRSRNHSAR